MRSKAKPKSLGDLLRKAKAEAAPLPRKLSRAGEPALVVRSLTLTLAADATLQRLSAEASAHMGRKVSGSAIVRGLLRLAEQKDPTHQLIPLLTLELTSGTVVWGRERK